MIVDAVHTEQINFSDIFFIIGPCTKLMSLDFIKNLDSCCMG